MGQPARRIVGALAVALVLVASVAVMLVWRSRSKRERSREGPADAERELASKRLPLIALPGGPAPKHGYPTLVLLHGRGSSGEGVAELAAGISRAGVLVVSPTGPQDLGDERYDWPAEAKALQRYLEASVSLALRLHSAEADPACRFIGGFSRGGGVALWLAAKSAAYAGVIAISPVPPEDPTPAPAGGAPAAWLLVGSQDEVALGPSRRVVEAWQARGLSARLETHGGGHAPPDDWEPRVREAVGVLLRGCLR